MLRVNSLSGFNRRRQAAGGGGGGLTFVAHGVNTTTSSSFTLNPTSLGASVGDIMLVACVFENNTAITEPGGWTQSVDEEAPTPDAVARVGLSYQIFSGSVPGDQTWSSTSNNGAAYGYAIFSGVSSIGTVTLPYGANASGGLETEDITVGGSDLAVVMFALADAGSQTGETASFSGVVAEAHEDTSHVAGRYAMVGYVTSSGTISYTTSVLGSRTFQHVVVPLQ